MNRTFFKKILILSLSLGMPAVFSNISYSADTLSAGYKEVGAKNDVSSRYTLPPSKTQLEPCRQETLLLHPGIIEKQQMLHRNGDFWLRYEIQARDGSEWFTLCDLESGKIIREQKLADDGF
ncbi:MAG TPA: hypothetical protein VIF10_02165 [Methylobacter sp.]|jgi:hypothetical protein